MNDQVPQKPSVPQKLKDFNEELEALCKKYQYELRATLDASIMGIIPRIQAFEVSPKDQGISLKPKAPETPPANPAPETTPETPVDKPATA